MKFKNHSCMAHLSLYGGMVSGDLLLYGLGVPAGRSGVVRRILLRPHIEPLGE